MGPLILQTSISSLVHRQGADGEPMQLRRVERVAGSGFGIVLQAPE